VTAIVHQTRLIQFLTYYYDNALFVLRAFRFLHVIQFYLKSNNSNFFFTFFFLSPTPFFFHSVLPFPYLFHPPYLPSVFSQYFSPFLSLPLSHFATSIPQVLNCLSLLIACSVPSFLSNTCFLSLRSHT
jgi:hypothetical protein